MFDRIKKEVLIEYLIKEIDCLDPLEKVYKTYVNYLLEISNVKYFNVTAVHLRKFISLLNLVEKKIYCVFAWMNFCNRNKLVEDVLGRKLVSEDYD